MKSALFAATAAIGFITFGQAARAAEAPYLDDRTDAAAVIRSLYNAISRHEYARAWDYFGDTKPAKDFDSFAKGYEGTETVEVVTGNAGSDGAAGSIYYTIPVAIRAVDKGGNGKVFAGCYTLRQVNAEIQAPPFSPIRIEKGALKPSDKDLGEALPESCGDSPPIPKKDAELDQAKRAFLASYADECDPEGPAGRQIGDPTVYSISYKPSDDQPDKTVRLFQFFCSMAAYNESSIFYFSDAEQSVNQLQFAVPELDIQYENGNTEGKVEHIGITGFRTVDRLVNAGYDENAHTLVSNDKWRGPGDASSSGTYLFRNGMFALVQYDVDASYDGEINPEAVIDYNTAP